MARKYAELREEITRDPVRRQRLEEMHRAAKVALALGDLRQDRGETQVGLAAKLGTSQHNVSRMEHSENPYLSTLREYVAALGGELKIIASFPDGDVLLVPAQAVVPQAQEPSRANAPS